MCWPTLVCNVVKIPSNTPLEKTDFPFGSRYQLQIAPWPYFMCMCVCARVCLRIYMHHIYAGAHGGQKAASDDLKLGLQAIVFLHVGAGNSSTRVLYKNPNC